MWYIQDVAGTGRVDCPRSVSSRQTRQCGSTNSEPAHKMQVGSSVHATVFYMGQL